MTINYDELAEVPVAVSDDDVKSIAALADRLLACDAWIEQQESRLKEAKKNREKLSAELIPEAMRQAGVKEFTLENGVRVETDSKIRAKIRVKDQEAAYAWLRENGMGDIIRNEFKITFGMGEDEQADCLTSFLADTGQDYNQKQDIPWNTLEAFVRREMEANDHGEDWESMFGVYRHTTTQIIRPKT